MILISRVAPDQYDAPQTDLVASDRSLSVSPYQQALLRQVHRVSAECAAEDGAAPLDEATLLRLARHGIGDGALWVAAAGDIEAGAGMDGFALTDRAPAAAPAPAPAADRTAPGSSEADEPVDVSIAVGPAARGAGTGRALAQAVLEAYPGRSLSAWSHGNHPAAARLASSLGFERVRDLWVMRRPLSEEHPLPEVTVPGGTVVRTFEAGRDEDAVLAVNAAAFAHHPEQGALSREDLEQRMAEPWFDPAGLFLAEAAPGSDHPGRLLGFHWTKVHPAGEAAPGAAPFGEVYVVGIAPDAQGLGLGSVLTLTGLHHLRSQGLGEVILYVEADNAAAVAVYSRLGFTHAEEDTHVRYHRP